MTEGLTRADALHGLGIDPAIASVIGEVADERQRQVDVEGWTPDHDDEHRNGQLAKAAAAYALAFSHFHGHSRTPLVLPSCWPWAREWWKPTGGRRDLVRAAALIVAEIERLDRLA